MHAFDQPEIVAGQGTIGLELAEQVPEADTVLVAIGGGGLIGGMAAWYEGRTRVVGVEPETSTCMPSALDAGEPVDVTTAATRRTHGCRRRARSRSRSCRSSSSGWSSPPATRSSTRGVGSGLGARVRGAGRRDLGRGSPLGCVRAAPDEHVVAWSAGRTATWKRSTGSPRAQRIRFANADISSGVRACGTPAFTACRSSACRRVSADCGSGAPGRTPRCPRRPRGR